MEHLGLYLIFGIILLPVYIFVITLFLGKPRSLRTSVLVILLPMVLTAIVIVFIFALSRTFSFILP